MEKTRPEQRKKLKTPEKRPKHYVGKEGRGNQRGKENPWEV